MMRTIEAIVESDKHIRILEDADLTEGQKVLVTLLDDIHVPADGVETALLSENSLGVDWNRKEEEQAWSNLK